MTSCILKMEIETAFMNCLSINSNVWIPMYKRHG